MFKALKSFLILLAIELAFSEILKFKHSNFKTVDGWNLYFNGAQSKKIHECHGMFILPEAYVTDPACIHR